MEARLFDGSEDGNADSDFCIINQLGAAASFQAGRGSLQAAAHQEGLECTQFAQVPGLQTATSHKYGVLFCLSEMDEDGKCAATP
jgi:hypothetical protein